MLNPPCIAVGTVQPYANYQPAAWALLDCMGRLGWYVQSFFYQSRFVCREAALPITGRRQRHLDSWLMTPRVCRQLLEYGLAGSDLGLIEGRYDAARGAAEPGGSLDRLCDWLGAPRVAVIDVASIDRCNLPPLAAPPDALLLDNVEDAADIGYWKTLLEPLYRAPVLGALPRARKLRALLENLPAGSIPSRDLCSALGEMLAPSLRRSVLANLMEAGSRREPVVLPPVNSGSLSLTVAMALDDAFCCYFPDTLDLLEACGARLRDFSPLTDDSLPPADILYFGCGNLSRWAERLAANHCMKQALRSFIEGGGRVYAEGAGLAYLCRQIIFDDGRELPMAGVLPAAAECGERSILEPAEAKFSSDSWLAAAGESMRGYRDRRWTIHPFAALRPYARDERGQLDMLGAGGVIGSRVHLHFAAQPAVLASFFQPHLPIRAGAFY